MSEGIEFNPLGTIDVTFDDKTYHLGRPKFRQFKYFSAKLEAQRDEVVQALDALNAEAAEAKKRYAEEDDSPEAKAELARLQAELKRINRTPFYERTVDILREMFAQVGEPLPDDEEEWPAWLAADSTIPGEILNHWKSHPKASGATPPA